MQKLTAEIFVKSAELIAVEIIRGAYGCHFKGLLKLRLKVYKNANSR